MGKIKKRADGRYMLNVYLGLDQDGKSKYKSVYGKTQKEVKQKAEEIRYKLGKGMDMLNAEITFEELCKRWEAYKRPLLREQQLKDYLTALKPFDRLKPVRINKLLKVDFQEIINEYALKNPTTGKPTSKGTLRGYRMAARQVIDFAVENRILDFNPVDYVKIPTSSPKKERRALTEQEQQWIMNTPHRAQLPAMIMMLSGLRLGECLALQWRDVNLKTAEIYVHQKLLYKQSPPVVSQGAKTQAGIRTVNIPKKLVEFLKAQPKHNQNDYICTSANGKLYSSTSWKTVWDSYLKDLNLKYGDFSRFEKQYKSKFDPAGVPFVIEPFSAHYLRHTHATNLFRCGKDILYIQQQLGHTKPETTLNIYTHLVQNHTISRTSKVINFDKYINKIGEAKAQ